MMRAISSFVTICGAFLLASSRFDLVTARRNVKGSNVAPAFQRRASRELGSTSMSMSGKGGKGTMSSTMMGGMMGGSSGSDTGGDGLCFSGRTVVQVEGKGNILMKDLQVGERVLTINNQYRPVYGFGHWMPLKEAKFIQLHVQHSKNSIESTANKSPLEVTPEHLVFLKDKLNPRRADSITVGDILQTSSGGVSSDENGALVTRIGQVTRKGLYAPLTAEGYLSVNGILASSYISLQETADEFVEFQNGFKTTIPYQKYVHMVLAPFRLLCRGVSSSFCTSFNDNGMPHYIAHGIKFQQFFSRQHAVIHFFAIVFSVTVAGTCLLLENVFGANVAPYVLLAAIALLWMKKRNRIGVSACKAKTT